MQLKAAMMQTTREKALADLRDWQVTYTAHGGEVRRIRHLNYFDAHSRVEALKSRGYRDAIVTRMFW